MSKLQTTKKNLLSYNEATDIIRKELKGIKNIKEYCLRNNISYNPTIQINNSSERQFPEVAQELLKSFGHEVEIVKAFRFK